VPAAGNSIYFRKLNIYKACTLSSVICALALFPEANPIINRNKIANLLMFFIFDVYLNTLKVILCPGCG
jgi:hypothetical protein